MRPRIAELGDKNCIGATVTKLRKLHRMTQKELMARMQSRGIDINYTSLSKLEGQTRIATDKEVFVIAEIFQVDMKDLFK
ncbi:helix-turn-helix domain-containing protein [Massiliimalia massiliensis]|uniref:helix-turn-helix domain-containing protein n=1 Tax=Massiliimalia massiliensis TaxID=1852384 RepID=UPI00098721E7|nr:helix-turn-helix transcriptional regulator [Massiliimalia massiliensis]